MTCLYFKEHSSVYPYDVCFAVVNCLQRSMPSQSTASKLEYVASNALATVDY